MVSRSLLAVLGLVVLTPCGPSVHAAEPAATSVTLEIRAQPLRDALNEFGRQSGLQVVFVYTDIDGTITSSPLAGRYSPQAALERLLADTPLAYEFINPRTVAIRRAGTLPRDETAPSATSHALENSRGSGQLRLAPGESPSSAAAPRTRQTSSARDEDGIERLTLEEVIVTAQKRKEVLREIPQSVTVLSAATLERQQAHDLQDYVGLVPGMSLQSNARGNTRLTLRGINAGGVGSTVAVYVDDVPYGSSSGLADAFFLSGDFDTIDIDRLEVLRGPQGTLYGASALGGVLKFVTTAPQTDAFSASVSAGAETVSGGDLGYSGTGTLNVSLGERFAVRASGFYRRYGGFVDSVSGPIPGFGGTPAAILDARRADDVNEVDIYGGRVSGLFRASDTFSLRLTALLQNIDSAGSNVIETDPVTLEPLNGRLTFSQYHPETSDIEYRIYSATLDWDLGFASLVSSSSYATLDNQFVTDFTFQFAPVLTAFFGDPATRPLGAVRRQQTTTDKTTQELRLASPDNDTFEWLVGAFYTREKSQIGPQAIRATEGISDVVATDIPLLSDALLPSIYREYAGFANATWHLAPRFDLSFGGRWSRNEQEADLTITGLINEPGQAIPDLDSTANVFRYSVAPRFELSDTASLYARIATGYRPGGPNIVPPAAPPDTPRTYEADQTTNYELGLKADWLDRALSLDIAAYYIDWKDIQLFAAVNGTGVNTNGGTAVSRGVEFAVRVLPTHCLRGLILMLDGAYSDAYLTQDTPAATGGLDGDPLPYVPDWSLNLSGDYEWPVLGTATAYIGSSIRHVGEQTADFGVRTAGGTLRRIQDYRIVDVRAGLRTERWSLDVYAKNVGDELAITSIQLAPVGFLPNGAIGTGINRPRTVGVNLSVRF